MDGEHYKTLRGEGIGEEFRNILDNYVMRKYGKSNGEKKEQEATSGA
jgi:(E)-4-hydroxy-3-methylbut-2-enyl-diphosphate synthase